MTLLHKLHNKENMCKPSQRGEAGFTMLELIIVMVLTSILSAYTFQILTNSLKTMRDLRNRKVSNDDAVNTLEKLTRDLREAGTIFEAGPTIADFNYPLAMNLVFQKVTDSSSGWSPVVRYIYDIALGFPSVTSQNLYRQGGFGWGAFPPLGGLPNNDHISAQQATSVNFGVTNVLTGATGTSASTPGHMVNVQMDFANSPGWKTGVSPRNYGL